jgi:DNA replication licensing factor MCM5
VEQRSTEVLVILRLQSVYTVPVSNASSTGTRKNTTTVAQFQQFLTSFREHESFIYRDRLRANVLRKEYTLEIEMSHLIGWDEELASRCRTEPGEIVPLVRFLIEGFAWIRRCADWQHLAHSLSMR